MPVIGVTAAAVSTDFTVAQIVTEGLKRGGRVSPSADEVTDATDFQFRQVKADIQLYAAKHELLKKTAITAVTQYISRYNRPSDVHIVDTVLFLDPNAATGDGRRDTLQAGTATGGTFATGFDMETDEVVGGLVVTLTGTGALDMVQITDYNNSTKVFVCEAWVAIPDNTTTYLFIQDQKKLWEESKPHNADTRITPWVDGVPTRGAMMGNQIWLNVAPDNTYALLWTYWSDLDRLSTTGATFLAFMREHNQLFIQGVAVYTMQRFDDERYLVEKNIYDVMLTAFGGLTSDITLVQYEDLS